MKDIKGIQELEKAEANKFQKRLKKQIIVNDLVVKEKAWTKFQKAKRPYGGYVASIRALGDIKGKYILEVGCGSGWLSVILCKLGARVEAFDISDASVKIAKRRSEVNRVSDQVNYRVMSAHDLDYGDNTFDIVYGLNVLHHVNVEKAIIQIKRVLKPRGKAVFCEPVFKSNVIECLRKLIPVPIDDDEENPALPLNTREIQFVCSQFNKASVTNYRFLSSLDRIFNNQRLNRILLGIDQLVFLIPFVKVFARQVVLELYK